jgi:hypothetical protein
MSNVKVVFAGSEQILGKFKIRFAGLIALRRRKEKFGIFNQANGDGEDAHQESSILRSANQASLGDRDEFLSQLLAPLTNDAGGLADNNEGACNTGKNRAKGES